MITPSVEQFTIKKAKVIIIISIIIQLLFYPFLFIVGDNLEYISNDFRIDDLFYSDFLALSAGVWGCVALEIVMVATLGKKNLKSAIFIPVGLFLIHAANFFIISALAGNTGEGLFELFITVAIYFAGAIPVIIALITSLPNLLTVTDKFNSNRSTAIVACVVLALSVGLCVCIPLDIIFFEFLGIRVTYFLKDALGRTLSGFAEELITFGSIFLMYALSAVSSGLYLKHALPNTPKLPMQENTKNNNSNYNNIEIKQ